MADATRYLVIHTSEDGDVSLEPLTATQLRDRLDKKAWGEVRFTLSLGTTFRDLRAHEGLIIIKGELVVPKPKQVVTAWDVGE